MKVVAPPPVQFTCDACGATNEGEPHEFSRNHTMPPTWNAKCAFCGKVNRCSPTPLVVRAATGHTG